MAQAIGVIGGVGPYAGVDLVLKIFQNTIAQSDQDHIDLYLTSTPSVIADRTTFLLEGGENPAQGLIKCFDTLASSGATVIVIPCNTAHAPTIWDHVDRYRQSTWPAVRFLNMIQETLAEITEQFSTGGRIGLLATRGTHQSGIYRRYFEESPHLALIEPDEALQVEVHRAIYDRQWGIKVQNPPSDRARETILGAAKTLIEEGCDAIILGCTELPLAVAEGEVVVPLFDPTKILARAAIRESEPQKLRR
jgi:aspartate racemase